LIRSSKRKDRPKGPPLRMQPGSCRIALYRIRSILSHA
jgi:hypothetical protein